MKNIFKKKRIYLDHASTTPIDGQVLRVMNSVYENNYFNAGALYEEGVSVAQKINDARKSVAKNLGTTSEHIIFSRGGTESVNLGIVGVIEKFRQEKRTRPQPPVGKGAVPLPHVIVSEIEHAAVLETVKDFQKKGLIELSLTPVNSDGIVDVDELKKLLKQETILVSVMYVNNEIGTIQPIKEIAKLLRWHKKQMARILPFPRGGGMRSMTEGSYPLFHTDAIQAANYLDLKVDSLGIDLMSLSGSKIYGPKSSGILYVRNKNFIAPIFHGGEQEFGLRAGTEDIAQIVGFAKAFEIARTQIEKENARLAELQEYFFAELKKNIPGVIVNGAWRVAPSFRGGQGGVSLFEENKNTTPPQPPLEEGATTVRIPNNINVSIPKISGERLVIELDARGICASSKSACREDSDEESHVIAAIRKDQKKDSSNVEGSLRFTMGRMTTKKEITKTVFELAEIIKKIRDFEVILTK